MKTPSVKILVCYHKPYHLFKDDILTPIHLGRTLAKDRMSKDNVDLKWLLANLIGDDTGENISNKNISYNELTGIYWAWKNYDQLGDPDYIGLMHYRRHFVFKEMQNIVDVSIDKVEDNYFSRINYSSESIKELLADGSILIQEGDVGSIEKHYANNHNIKDLYSIISIIDELYPEYSITAKKYINQNLGNFFNMFIFNKKIFFEYCEWIFNILEEYESRNDLTEKRLFVSERLTGIFIQHKIAAGTPFKKLPVALIEEPTTIPIAMPWDEDLFSTTVTILSHVLKSDSTTNYKFYLLGNPNAHQSDCLNKLSNDYNFIIEIIDPSNCLKENNLGLSSIYYPLVLHLLLPGIDKCVYLNNKILAMQDESKFYRTCNVDDFWICGIPIANDDPMSKERIIVHDLMVLNLKRLRDHRIENIYKKKMITETTDPIQIMHMACGLNIGYFPQWFYKKTIVDGRTELFDSEKGRGKCQYEARWSSYVYFNAYSPIYSMQGIYSILWWNVASKIPGYINPPSFDIDQTLNKMVEQQHSINKALNNNSPYIKNGIRNKFNFGLSIIYRFKNAWSIYGFKEATKMGFKAIIRMIE